MIKLWDCELRRDRQPIVGKMAKNARVKFHNGFKFPANVPLLSGHKMPLWGDNNFATSLVNSGFDLTKFLMMDFGMFNQKDADVIIGPTQKEVLGEGNPMVFPKSNNKK